MPRLHTQHPTCLSDHRVLLLRAGEVVGVEEQELEPESMLSSLGMSPVSAFENRCSTLNADSDAYNNGMVLEMLQVESLSSYSEESVWRATAAARTG
jgi:hypothetical protein